MTEEKYKEAQEWAEKMERCEYALKHVTHGVYAEDRDGNRRTIELPDEVRNEIRKVIESWRQFYAQKFDEV